jgi:arylsulfatase A-like enzyme
MHNRPPHIVIFNPDQWRGDTLGHVGHPAAVTPNIDRLVATDSVSFANAFCQNPVCTPSRCSFMTGWYPHTAGHRTMFHMLRGHEPMLLKELKDAGYFVWWGGKNDLVPAQHPLNDCCHVKHEPADLWPSWQNAAQAAWRGRPDSDDYYSFFAGRIDSRGQPFYHDYDWGCVTGAIEFIRNRPADRPICIYLPIGLPHPPYGVEEPYFSMIDRSRVPARVPTPDWTGWPAMLRGIAARQGLADWPEDRWRELRAVYLGMCARQDALLGLLLAGPASTTTRPCSSSATTAISPATMAWSRRTRTPFRTASPASR